ncbi:MAG: hypothetical protein LBQ60_15350 [Bacteroidales bacterium]|jgi:hypothetical protein|nr:hypothetical protein [Bacteroidales bacterium]
MKNFLCLLLAVLAFNLVSCNDDDKDCPECETCTECAECPECPDCPKPTTDEINELAYANENDWYNYDLKGKVKQRTELYYGNATFDADGSLLEKGDVTQQQVIEFNNLGFITAEKYYELRQFNDVNNTKKLVISSEETSAFNAKGQVTEEISTSYQYSYNDPNEVPTISFINKKTYTYTETQATEIESDSSDGGVTWTDRQKTVYELDEYGRTDWNNSTKYLPKSTEWNDTPNEGRENKVTKDNKGNITSSLQYSFYPGPYQYFDYYEYTYLYY